MTLNILSCTYCWMKIALIKFKEIKDDLLIFYIISLLKKSLWKKTI